MKRNKLGQEPAFATSAFGDGESVWEQGMSKRFYAACAAMQGFISGFYGNNDAFINLRTLSEKTNLADAEVIAKISYEFADALLKEELNERA